MTCKRQYIRDVIKDEVEAERLEQIHSSIGDKAKASKLFREEGGKLMLLKNKIQEGFKFIGQINQEYGKVVAKLPRIEGFRHKLSVDVLPLSRTGEQGKFFQLDDRGINPLLESSIEKSLQPELISVFLTPNTFLDKLSKYGFTKEEILYLVEPLAKNPSLWVEAPNVNNLISYRVAEQMKFSQTETSNTANEELDKTMKDFLKNLNITIQEYNDLKEKTGLNILGVANILEKSIDLAKNRKIDTLPEEAAHFYVELLAKRNTEDNLTEYNLYKDLMSKIESWEKFEDIKKAYMPKYNDLEMVKKEAIAKAIAEAIVTRFESKNDPLKKAIIDFLEWIKSVFKTDKNFNLRILTDNIATKMLSKDYTDIAKDLDESAILTDYKDVDKDTLDLINKFSKIGAYLTGSIALRKQGTIYRTKDELFHDLDFKVPIENQEKFLKNLKDLFPEIEMRKEFDAKSSYTTLWKLNYNGKEYDIDFFFSKTKFPLTKDNMVHWKDTFQAKLDMGRTKDVTDLINFIPFQEPVDQQKKKFLRFFQLEEPTPAIKPGVQELFESNPELANAVYEALGFKSFDNKGISLTKENSIGWRFIELNNKRIGRVKFVNNGEKNQLGLSIEIYDEFQNKGYGQIVHVLMADLAKKEEGENYNLYSDYQNSRQEVQLLESLVKKGYAEKIGDVGKTSKDFPDTFTTNERAYRIKTSDEIATITPQQKQQAQQLYSQYLDTVFPDSKVKDIVYHGTDKNDIEFIKNNIEGYFSKVKGGTPNAIFFSKDKAPKGSVYDRKYNIPVILNVKNSFVRDDKGDRDSYPESYKTTINNAEKNGYDGVQILNTNDNFDTDIFVVFDPNQIYKLGSKQDIEGFKEFVGKEKKAEEPVESNKIQKYLETETSEDKEVGKPELKKEVETREKAVSDVISKIKDLLTRLGIKLNEFEEIYIEQENINALTKKLEDKSLTEKQRSDIQNQINDLKAKGVDKRAIAFADILNRTIGVSVDGRTEDLTEEVLHFIVDIIEQKYPDLYRELYDKVWSYDKYKQVKEDYKDRYETEEEFRKEAITQVLNDYLLKPLETEPESEYQNQKTEKFWDKIVNSLKNLFTKTANVDIDPFKVAIENLLNSDFISAEDVQYLNKRGLFFSLRKEKSAEEVRDTLLKESSKIEIKPGKEGKPRYFKNGVEVAKRVSDIVKAYYDSVFGQSEKKDNALNEQKREEGVEIHSIFQHTFAKYVSPKGEVLSTPLAPNNELKELSQKYPNIALKIDQVVKEIIKVNPDSYFLAELKVSNGTKIGGTLDLVVINKKTGRTSVYDWKSKRGMTYDKKLKSYVQISQMPWWNINGWRIQLTEYSKILKANGVTNFGEVRMIPVLTFEKKVGNEYVIDRIEITPFERALVDPRKRQLLPVIGEEEKSPYKTIGKITEKIRAVINQNIQRIKADYKLKPDLEEENAALENMYTVLLATDNISSALGSLKVILQDAKDLANKAVADKKKINDLTDAELYQYYKDIQSTKEKLSVYQEAEPDGTPTFTILGIAQDIFGKRTTTIRKEYEDLLEEFKKNPTQQLEDQLKKLKPSYDIAVSLIKIEAELKEVLPVLNEYSKDYFDAYATRNGVTDILGEDLGQNFLGKFMNNIRGLYSLNFKTAQLAKKLIMKANSIVRDKNKKATDSMYALRDKFLKGKPVYDIEDLFKNLIYYDKDKNDYFLVPEINKEFSKQFFEMKEKFEKGYNSQGGIFFNTKEYQEIKEWLEKNLEIDAWRKDFEEKKKAILTKFEQANKGLKDTDPLDYASLLKTKEAQIEYFNNIFASPKAWGSLKKYRYAKRSKWEAPEYKKLTSEEKEMHKNFTSIYARAESIGYVQGYQNYYRIPFKVRESKSFIQALNPAKAFIAAKEDEVYNSFSRIDPVTGQEIIEIPTHMTTYLPAVEKGKRVKSLDLFQVYLEFEQNLNRFEEMTKVEDMLLDLVKIEDNKDKEIEVNTFGNLTGKKSKKEKANLLQITREDALKKLVYHALYNIKYERDVFIPFTKVNLKNVFKDRKYVSVKKTFQWLNDYSTALFIQASLKITGGAFIASSVVAATGSSKNIQGSKYLTSLLSRLNPKNINSSYRKAFNHRITQKEVEELNLKRTETLKRLALYSKEYLLNHLKHVDTFIQDSVFDASLEKWFVINNKIVNAETYISSLIPNQDKMSYQEIKKKEAELYEKNKENTLAKYLEKNTKDNKTDISKLDKDSVYEFEQALRLESKKIVGNMSDEDMFAMRTGFFGAIFTKFKTWMPELFNTFFGGIYWREEGKRFEAGRFSSFYRSVMDAVDKTDASGDEKSMMKLGIEYVSNSLMMLYNTGLFTVGKNKDVVIKRLETRYNLYVESLQELGVDKIPSRKEYIDLTLQEAQNARNFLASVFVLYLFSNILGVLSGDDDPEDHEYLVGTFEKIGLTLEPVDNEILLILFQFANNFTVKGLKELQTYFSAESTYEAFTKLSFPALGALSILGKGTIEAGKVATPFADGEIKYTLDAIPVVRPALRSYIQYTDDEWVEEQLNVDRNYRLRKQEEEE